MLKKKIKYIDYDGNEREEDFYFNISRAELMEMETGVDGGLVQQLTKIIAEQDIKRIVEEFKSIIKKAYGEKSPDGKRFVKTPEVLNAFLQSEAYCELFMELAGDADKAAAFVKAILPKAPTPETK